MVKSFDKNYAPILMLIFIMAIAFVGFQYLITITPNTGFAGSGSIFPFTCPKMSDNKCDGAVYGNTKDTVLAAYTDARDACTAKEITCKQTEQNEENGNNTACQNAACIYAKNSKITPCFWASCSHTNSNGVKTKYRPDQFNLNTNNEPISPNGTGFSTGVSDPSSTPGWKCEFYFQYNYFKYTCELPPPNKSLE